MKYLIIGDVHNKVALAEKWCTDYPEHIKIFVGDYFDDFGDTAYDAIQTAEWLKQSLHKPDRIHLMGNHDYPYMTESIFGVPQVFCPGWNEEKGRAVRKILTKEDWELVKFYQVVHDKWYVSHAGFNQYWWAHPLTGDITTERIDEIIERNKRWVLEEIFPTQLFVADFTRGGDSSWGGLLWQDWSRLPFIKEFNQVVGHTPFGKTIQIKAENDITNILVDCWMLEALEISSEGYKIVKHFKDKY